jgi:hypothetical protein
MDEIDRTNLPPHINLYRFAAGRRRPIRARENRKTRERRDRILTQISADPDNRTRVENQACNPENFKER